MRITFLNPPGRRLYLREYYCSQISKAAYYPQPVDFIMLSARLREGNELFLLDAIKDRLAPEECLKKLKNFNPDVVIFLSGVVSWQEDAEFLRRLKEKIKAKIVGIGDIFLEEGRQIIEKNSAIDALLMDFCSPDITYYLKNEFEKITHMHYRSNAGIVTKVPDGAEAPVFEIPIPRHDLFINRGYTYPFVRNKGYATVLTDYGCPYKCSFCVMGALGYKYRLLENVFAELDYLRQYGIKEILFMDQSFGVLRQRNIALYQAMIERKYNFGWVCYSRVDLIDYATLELMKKSGCHTIMFGVETASNELLKKYNKGYTREQVESAFRMCRKLKVRTVGTFILGLPEDTLESCYETIEFAKRLNCDFASFNFAFPRPKTGLRKKMAENKLLAPCDFTPDQSGQDMHIKTLALSSKELAKIRKQALLQFYLRPGYLIRQLFVTQTLDEACVKFKNFISMFYRNQK